MVLDVTNPSDAKKVSLAKQSAERSLGHVSASSQLVIYHPCSVLWRIVRWSPCHGQHFFPVKLHVCGSFGVRYVVVCKK
jgi:hypothetical protein